MMDVMELTRVDRWLWAVRLTKTRPDAAAACRGGHVRVNDRPAKPSTLVSPPVTRCAPGWVTRRGSSRWHGWSKSGSVGPMP
jgi:hypothetical protein